MVHILSSICRPDFLQVCRSAGLPVFYSSLYLNAFKIETNEVKTALKRLNMYTKQPAKWLNGRTCHCQGRPHNILVDFFSGDLLPTHAVPCASLIFGWESATGLEPGTRNQEQEHEHEPMVQPGARISCPAGRQHA